MELERVRSSRRSGDKSVWIPKAICVASQYPFFDYYAKILDDLCSRLRCGMMAETFEAHLFNIVFKIPVPVRNREIVRYPTMHEHSPLDMCQPAIMELPYENHSFFERLFALISPDDMITAFTLMLFE